MTSKGVKNFCPDDPTDIEKWQDGLTQEQVIDTTQWLFDNCWKARPNRNEEFESECSFGPITRCSGNTTNSLLPCICGLQASNKKKIFQAAGHGKGSLEVKE